MKDCLGRSASQIPRSKGVESVFDNVKITRRQDYCAEVVDRMKYVMEFIGLIFVSHRCYQVIQLREGPAIDLPHVFLGNAVPRRIKTMKIAQCIASRVA